MKARERAKKRYYVFKKLQKMDLFYFCKICIYYNTSPETADEVRMTEKKEGSFLDFSPENGENGGKITDKNKCNPSKFKHYDITKKLAEKICEAKILRERGATDDKANGIGLTIPLQSSSDCDVARRGSVCLNFLQSLVYLQCRSISE